MTRRTLIMSVLVVGAAATCASPAAAELDGPCTGIGTWRDGGFTVDPKTTDGPVEIPIEDTVEYTGTVGGGAGNVPERNVSGEVKVDMPFPLPDFTPGDWDDPDAVKTSKKGTYDYDIPTVAPRGADIEVSGFHDDAAFGRCDGSVTLQLEGGFTSSPAGPVAFVITALSAVGVVISARPKTGGAW